ncbi:MAG: AraC family transcriptional regulator [Pseudomonadota bacterium]
MTDLIADTTEMACSIHPFDDALQDLRVTGSLLLNEAYRQPWAIGIPDEAGLSCLLRQPCGQRTVPIHLVRRGSFELTIAGRDPIPVKEGEAVICMNGERHLMGLGHAPQETSLVEALAGQHPARTNSPPRADSHLTCGVFSLHDTSLNPLLAALPPVLHLSFLAEERSTMLRQIADMLLAELDEPSEISGYAIARLLELFCAAAIRRYMIDDGRQIPGWFRGLDDHRICKAIALVHGDPGHNWTVTDLAQYIGLSPSRFAARFREGVGQSVIAYVTQWRMHVAIKLIRDGKQSLPSIAKAVGYESFPAFSRAFKKVRGRSPSSWRSPKGAIVQDGKRPQ